MVEEAKGKFAFVGDILNTGFAREASQTPAGLENRAAGKGKRIGEDFPSRLNPWRTQAVPRLVDFGSFRVSQNPGSAASGKFVIDAAADPGFVALRTLGVDSSGVLGPISEVNFPAGAKAALGIPADASQYCFIHPLDGADALAADPRYAWCLHDPTFTLLILGGFAYFSSVGDVVAVLALTGAGAGTQSIGWDSPRRWTEQQLPPVALRSCSRGTALCKNGARRFCWLANGQLECEFGGLLFEVDRGDGGELEFLTFAVFKKDGDGTQESFLRIQTRPSLTEPTE